MLDKVNRHNVSLLSGLFRERADLNRNYLFELDSTCLLQNFYLEAGIVMPGLQVANDPEGAKLHWGWEAPDGKRSVCVVASVCNAQNCHGSY